jgi:hypothetical protein
MSGTLQPPPTATMSVASGASGVFPVSFGYYPAEGSRCVSAQYNWATQAGYAEDLSQLAARGIETTIQSVFVDNAANTQAVTLVIGGSGQVVVIPPLAQGTFPLYFTGTPSFTISVPAAAAGLTRLFLLNVPGSGAGVWYPAGSTSSTGTPLTYQAAPTELAGGASQAFALLDSYGSQMVDSEVAAPVYSAAYFVNTSGTTVQDIAALQGSASKTIRIHRISVSAYCATAGVIEMGLVLSTSLFTSSSTVVANSTKHDSTNAAATAVVWSTVGNVNMFVGGLPLFEAWSTALSTPAAPVAFTYGDSDQSIVLRGTTQAITVRVPSNTLPATSTFGIKFKWSEV